MFPKEVGQNCEFRIFRVFHYDFFQKMFRSPIQLIRNQHKILRILVTPPSWYWFKKTFLGSFCNLECIQYAQEMEHFQIGKKAKTLFWQTSINLSLIPSCFENWRTLLYKKCSKLHEFLTKPYMSVQQKSSVIILKAKTIWPFAINMSSQPFFQSIF